MLVQSIAIAQYEDTTEINKFVVSTGNIKPSTSSNTVHNVRIITAASIERQGPTP